MEHSKAAGFSITPRNCACGAQLTVYSKDAEGHIVAQCPNDESAAAERT